MIKIIFVAALLIVMVAAAIYTAKRNNEIKTAGIETDAVVSRIKEDVSTDTDNGGTTVSYTYYVTYRTMAGETVEAQLASGKSFDLKIGRHSWDADLYQGSKVRIKYLPDKPDYVIMAE